MTKNTSVSGRFGDLHDYYTGAEIRRATKSERDDSRSAAESDGGAGVIIVEIDGEERSCYVQE